MSSGNRLRGFLRHGKCVTRVPIDFVSPSKQSSVKFEQTLFFFIFAEIARQSLCLSIILCDFACGIKW